MTRRLFLRQLGATTALPLLANSVRAESKVVKRIGEHSVLSCNIRVALPEDEATGNGWNSRREFCIEVIRRQNADIICLQEVLREQMQDLQKAFPNFGHFGFAGPEMDARMVGYHGIAKNPILFSLDRYELVTAGGYWLSETPHLAGSLSWDSARARHVNWIRLRDRKTGAQFRVLSTHLDHVSQKAREEQIKLILADSAIYAEAFPQILAGDFNGSAENPVYKLVADSGWKDSRLTAPPPIEDGTTINGFDAAKAKKKRGPIDFIFIRGSVKSGSFKIIRDSKDGRFPSDHFFISAKLAIEG